MKRFSRTGLFVLSSCVFGLLSLPVTGHAKYDPSKDYQEIPAVVKQFPSPSLIELGTPAFADGKKDFTSQKEMEDFIQQLSQKSEQLKVRVIGESQKGRAIPLLVFSDSRSALPENVLKNGKPTVLILALQHGNEPASGEAALAYAKNLAEGKEGDVLTRVNVLIMPRANPDGAENFSRELANGVDLNRDHILLSSPESRAIADVLNQYQPDVVLDAHEYAAAGYWVEKFGALQRYDAMLQQATTNNLSARLVKIADKPFRESLVSAFEINSLSHSWHFTANSNDTQDKTLSMGDIGANNLRNVAGLHNSISFLLESRGIGLGKAHFPRRVFTQLVAMQTIVKTAAKSSSDLTALNHEVRSEIAAEAGQGAIVVKGKMSSEKRTISMIDAKTADGVKVDADWNSALNIIPVITRSRPYAYLLAPTEKKAAKQLQALGIEVYVVEQEKKIKAQQYHLVEQKEPSEVNKATDKKDATAAALTKTAKDKKAKTDSKLTSIATQVDERELPLTAGYFYIPLQQPLANLAIAVLEPETSSSFVTNGFIELPAKAQTVKKKKAVKTKSSKDEEKPAYLPIYRLSENPEISATLMP